MPRSALDALNPILDQTQADREFQATFQKDCGLDDLCQSQLEVDAELELDKEGKNVQKIRNIQNKKTRLTHQISISDDKYNLILGQYEELRLNVSVTNEHDSAYEAQLFVEHQKSVTYIAASKGQVICNKHNDTIVACTLGNPLQRNATVNLVIRFDPSALDDAEPQLSFNVFANTTSKQLIPREKTVLQVNIIKKAVLSIQGWALPEQAFYGGDVKGESAMEHIEDIGIAVQHTYQIYNDGPWRVPYLNVNIKWPHQVANDKEKGKWLLYLADKIVIEGATGECSVDGINPNNLPRRSKLIDMAGEPAEYMDYRSYLARMNKSQSLIAESSEKRTTSTKYSSSSVLNRVRRDHAVIIRAERLVDKDGNKKDTVNMVN